MATSLLPPTLDEETVGDLIATLQRRFYPPPSRGFTVRIGILWALTGACVPHFVPPLVDVLTAQTQQHDTPRSQLPSPTCSAEHRAAEMEEPVACQSRRTAGRVVCRPEVSRLLWSGIDACPLNLLTALRNSPRPSWTLTAVMYGFYELLYTGSFWRVYVLHRPQHAWNGIRSFDAVALFIGGWCISWSGLQVS